MGADNTFGETNFNPGMEDKGHASVPEYCIVSITKEDMKALIRIRNYFGENDKTQLEHLAYDVLDRIVRDHKKLL